jgi:ribose transport system permease protein
VTVLVIVMLVAASITRLTRFGRQLYAICANAEAARLSGLAVKRHLVGVLAISGWGRIPPAGRTP